ncbi:Methyltransferase type 12 [Shewanella halifaxensis HAW-EB4]|uniref:Methyltransferase type 12 n=1 Tax=Shewanella halifaxensis (strain HAW-EB4) TaxID=458817 RepID=B0TLY3_SHEHH|nr:class I SAM-dependent methyltransferase [Shewanella halifaxensis]ABZ77355.1 Methyltransferase type 12 [Shewanella halifaxensis HAW-EB4]
MIHQTERLDLNQVSVNTFDKLAQRYQDKYMDLAMYIDTFEPFINALPKQDARVLELACGPGNITRYLLSLRPQLSILATDLAPKMLILAQHNNPLADVALLDSRELNMLNERFDAIMCGFCLPYLSPHEALALIDDASQRLTANGVFYLSTMEGSDQAPREDISGDGEKMYTYFHRGADLVSALESAGFSIIELKRKLQPSPIGEVTDLFITARLDKA